MGLFRILLAVALGYVLWRIAKDILAAIEVARRSASARSAEPQNPAPGPTAGAGGDSAAASVAGDLWAFETLGLSPPVTREDIKDAYQDLVQQYHPDKVCGMGDELREVAERRTKEINRAYEHLKVVMKRGS